MEKVKNIAGWLIRHAAGIGYLVGIVTSASFFPALLAFGAGATPVQYGIGAASGLLAFILGRAAWVRTRLWRVDIKARERLNSDSSPFDPMEKIYRDKRLFLKDLAPLGRKEVRARKFINCEIIGPGDIVLDLRSREDLPFPVIRNNYFNDVNFIQVQMGEEAGYIHNAVWFFDCDFEGCQLFSMNLLFTHRLREDFNWITPKIPPPAGTTVAEVLGDRARALDRSEDRTNETE